MISIRPDRPVPLEQQIYDELRHAIAREEVPPGGPLPSVRQLAGDLGVHWNTVARAYRRLAEDGLVAVRRGRSVRVQTTADRRPGPPASIRERVRDNLRHALTEARLAGLPLEDVRVWFRAEADALSFRKERR